MAVLDGSASTTYKILTKLFCKKPLLLQFTKNYYPVQFDQFQFGISITNLSSTVFPGGKIKNVKIVSTGGDSLFYVLEGEWSIPLLNPNEEKSLLIEHMRTPLIGSVWVEGEIEVNDKSGKIEPYQCTHGIPGKHDVYKKDGKIPYGVWGDSLYIKSKNDEQQNKTNLLILALTIITVADSLVGLKVIWTAVVNTMSTFLVGLGEAIQKLGELLKY